METYFKAILQSLELAFIAEVLPANHLSLIVFFGTKIIFEKSTKACYIIYISPKCKYSHVHMLLPCQMLCCILYNETNDELNQGPMCESRSWSRSSVWDLGRSVCKIWQKWNMIAYLINIQGNAVLCFILCVDYDQPLYLQSNLLFLQSPSTQDKPNSGFTEGLFACLAVLA